MTKCVLYKIKSTCPDLLKWTDPEDLVRIIGEFFLDASQVPWVRRAVIARLQQQLFFILLGDPDSDQWLSVQWIGMHVSPIQHDGWWPVAVSHD